jgi:hypothetical protein
LDIESGIRIKLRFYNYNPNINLDATFELRNLEELVVFHTGALLSTQNDAKVGEYDIEFDIAPHTLNAGSYILNYISAKTNLSYS